VLKIHLVDKERLTNLYSIGGIVTTFTVRK